MQVRHFCRSAVEAATNYQPASDEALIDLAIVYFEAAQFDKALQPLGEAVTLKPRNANAHSMLGKTHFALGNYEKSAAELNTALELAPNDVDTSFTLAIAYLQQRQFAPARRVFDRMIAQFGDQLQLHVVNGRAFREAGLLPEAIDEFKKAIALRPTYPRAHYNLGLAYLMNEGASGLAAAEEEFKAEFALNPNEFFANYYLGIVYIFHRKWELSINFLKKSFPQFGLLMPRACPVETHVGCYQSA
jgi:tetratricopeptide (TPR) repeat protein